MLDSKLLRNYPDIVANNLKKRGYQLDIENLKVLEEKRKLLQVEVQELQSERNRYSKNIGQAKAQGDSTAIEAMLKDVNHITEKLNESEKNLDMLQERLQHIYLNIPNLLHDSVPFGKGEEDNLEIRRWGEPKAFHFQPKDHVALAGKGLDLERGALLSGSRFAVLKNEIARLHRALVQFMLDLHTQEHHYQEMNIPYFVRSSCLYGTGQLPKLADDQFFLKDDDLCPIPTAEVPLTNLVRDSILEDHLFPIKYVGHSPCFRREAGTYGKDMHGILRQHQFEKVELVQIVRPEDSYQALEELVGHAEQVLRRLDLPYRVITLCSGDIGFSPTKTYDLEVWLPGQNKFREISSCSNTEAFQARRMQARWRNPITNKPEYVHTLNGSGLAVGRTLVAVLENYQDENGMISIPEVLQPYMGGMKTFKMMP